jgi:hypothetical protein
MPLTSDERDRRNSEHLADPRPGDYWHEMYTPACVVLARDGDHVTLCRTTKAAGPDKWTWDLNRAVRMPLAEFVGWLCFKSEALKDKTWASIEPGWHEWAAKAYEEMKK